MFFSVIFASRVGDVDCDVESVSFAVCCEISMRVRDVDRDVDHDVDRDVDRDVDPVSSAICSLFLRSLSF